MVIGLVLVAWAGYALVHATRKKGVDERRRRGNRSIRQI
jgi:hypothetical protein